MILFNSNDNYSALSQFKVCIDFAKRVKEENLPVGRYELSDGIYCGVSESEAYLDEPKFFEAHRKYADLQCVVEGKAVMRVGFTDKMNFVSYLEEKDFVKVEGEAHTETVLTEDTFICLFPNDAHTIWKAKDSSFGKVKKIVFKIPIELFN
ncbi:MAG: YhcH/YjgK/YiaL family protein [Clostridia bacterium]|nr:YhcH/YjgK/YiaL family protein [Clostridia bacterium]